MKVNGVNVPELAINAADTVMRRKVGFRVSNIAGVVEAFLDHGTKRSRQALAHTVAERLIQRARRAGEIGPLNAGVDRSPYWRWIGAK